MTVSTASEIISPFCLQIPQTNLNKILYARSPPVPHKYIQDMWEFEEIDSDLRDMLLKNFTNCFRSGYVKSRGYVLPECYKKFGKKVEELEVRDDDLWVISFPKTGKFSPSHDTYRCSLFATEYHTFFVFRQASI